MARLFPRLVLCVFIVPLAGSELVIDVQPNVISPEITPQLVINCSVTNNQVQHLEVIKSLTLSRYNEIIREFDELIALDSLTQNLKQFVRFKYSQISFGNLYITLTLPNPTQFDARIYRCNADGANSEGTNISLFTKKAVEYETNSTALIEEIRRIKKDENKCSLKKDDLSDIKQRWRVYFSESSKIIKERIEPLTLKCTFQILTPDENETSRLQSLYILHESNGVVANINKDQAVITTIQGGNFENAQGEISGDQSKESYLQVTWSNLKHSDSGKYFCEAHVKHSKGKAERLNEMLTIEVISPTIDDLMEVIQKLVTQVDGDKESLQDVKQNIMNIKEDLNTKEQNIISIKEDLNTKQQSIISIKEEFKTKQENIQKDVTINQQNIQKIKEELDSKEQSMIIIREDFSACQQNISAFKENIEIMFANLSTSFMQVKTQINKGNQEDQHLIPKIICRDVNSTDERVVVTLTSGLKVMCDTKTDGGGWIIFQRRINGKVDFYRGWKEYRDGFGDYTIGEFYLGNEYISKLTSTRNFDLRIDFKYNHKTYFVEYSDFRILNETNNYQLKIGKYKGNASDEFSYHNNMQFSTFDRDNDVDKRNCALQFTGAWWYHSCHYSNLNGQWGSKEYSKGANWESITGYEASVSFVEMKIRER
uniref:Fibrinogen-related protein 3.1 n=2 Tax=Biomphalaria glabrata TaxID=6526 RepID=G3LHF8_BIOGL|nr:fibrinogen-related protein 3.1 [Biomphalaria glabrata]